MSLLTEPFSNAYLNRGLVRKLASAETHKKTAGSILGRLWLVVSPVLFMLVYTFTYAVVLRLRPSELTFEAYMVHLFAGLLPFLAISESLTGSVVAIRQNQSFLNNASFPTEALPLKVVVMSLFGLFWGLLILVMGTIVFIGPQLKMLLLFAVVPLHFLFMSGLAFLLSVLGALLKDAQNLIGYIAMIVMLASPIAYTENMIPESLRFYIYVNPFSFMIQSYQSCLVPGYFSETALGVFAALAIILFVLGFWLFMRVKKVITIYAQ